jgi:uncharacterized protein YacL
MDQSNSPAGESPATAEGTGAQLSAIHSQSRPPAESPLNFLEQQKRSQRVLVLVLRLLFIVLLMTVSLLPFVGSITSTPQGDGVWFTRPQVLASFFSVLGFGVLILAVDALTPNKKLGTVFGVYLGIVAGLVGALAIGALIDLVAQSWDLNTHEAKAYIGLVKVAIGIALCYLAVSIVLTTKDDVRLVIPYVEFAKQVRGVRPLLLDTSSLIDGRIEHLAQTGFLDAPLIVPEFVIHELQTLADSADRLKRSRGRRGLDLVSKLQSNPVVDVTITDTEVPGAAVDQKLLQFASDQNLRILTTDYNLNKVAQIRGVSVLNINDLANTLRPQVIPGESLLVEIVKHGEGATQGVGYLPDGTMVVVEDAASHIGEEVTAIVTNSLQTSAGRMIFGRVEGDSREGRDSGATPARMAQSATNQPRMTARPARVDSGESSPRNPRR